MRRSPESIISVLALTFGLAACTPHDPRIPHQLPAPTTPNVPPVVPVTTVAVVAPPAPPTPTTPPAPVVETADGMLASPRWDDAARLDAFGKQSIERAKAALTRVQNTPQGADPNALLDDFDAIFRELDTASGLMSLLVEVSPVEAVRTVAAKADQDLAKLRAEVWLDRKVYDALVAVDPARLDSAEPAMKRMLELSLSDFRLAGVDKSPEVRARLAAIQGEVKRLSQDYSANVNGDVRVVKLPAAKLADLPKDWRDAHPVDGEGMISVTTNYPDYFPVMEYAADESARRAMWDAQIDRGMPKNVEVLKSILTLRKEAATLLGEASWAAYAVRDAMARTPEAVTAFIADIAAAARPRAERDLARALVAKQKTHPDAKAIEVWDRFYYQGVVKKEDLAFDSEAVRPYFPYTAVKNGIFKLYGELFGVTFRPVDGAVTWAPDVEAWEMLDGDGAAGVVLGRFWLDMHPRADKFGHAAMFPIQTGLSGKHAQIPWASLVCNFPAPTATDKALMGHDDVVTFFHEFGHLIQHLLARGPTVKLAGDIDFDFIEAPSQLLEEWAWTPNILQRFARHVDTGEPIPADLVKRMKDADAFGRGMDLMRQIHLSAFSWFMHVEDPAALDFEAFTTAMYQKYSPYPRPEVDHLYTNFGHLTDYSSNYYTYQWSLAIAKDLFTRFESADGSGLVNLAVSAEYRKKLLEPGATRDINAMIEDFLGRPRNLDAYRKWIAN